MEMRERMEGNGESERFVLPNIRGSERRNGVQNLQVKGLKGVMGKGIVRVD